MSSVLFSIRQNVQKLEIIAHEDTGPNKTIRDKIKSKQEM